MKARRIRSRTLSVVLVAAVCTAGCSTQAKRVECDWRLKPINPPVQSSEAAAPENSKVRDGQ